jgi:hypothetical protein
VETPAGGSGEQVNLRELKTPRHLRARFTVGLSSQILIVTMALIVSFDFADAPCIDTIHIKDRAAGSGRNTMGPTVSPLAAAPRASRVEIG